jgi:hypothetical protein
MVKYYADGECDAEMVRALYELYPQGLREKDKTDYNSKYPLACYSLAAKANDLEYVTFKCTPNMVNICRFLIFEHPRLIRQKVHGGGLFTN